MTPNNNHSPHCMKELIIATQNAHKAAEIAAILPPDCTIRTLADFPEMTAPEETGRTFAANAAQKALALSEQVQGWVLADDSGLCVDALGGSPGILSARYAGSHGDDAANNRKLLSELRALPGLAPYSARFVCAMCLAKEGKIQAEFIGELEGQITLQPRGAHGFGYDPLFIPEGYRSTTLAELPAEVKNRISHRARALEQLATLWRQN